jgi:hypothetical protein
VKLNIPWAVFGGLCFFVGWNAAYLFNIAAMLLRRCGGL